MFYFQIVAVLDSRDSNFLGTIRLADATDHFLNIMIVFDVDVSDLKLRNTFEFYDNYFRIRP